MTVPNGDQNLLAARLKRLLGMDTKVYGHTRAGYTPTQLQASVQQVGFLPIRQCAYSRFFTEIVELMINFGYVFLLSRRRGGSNPGHIAPTSTADFKSHGLAYRLYSLAFPVLRVVAKLDNLLPARTGYAIIVEAMKPLTTTEATP